MNIALTTSADNLSFLFCCCKFVDNILMTEVENVLISTYLCLFFHVHL